MLSDEMEKGLVVQKLIDENRDKREANKGTR